MKLVEKLNAIYSDYKKPLEEKEIAEGTSDADQMRRHEKQKKQELKYKKEALRNKIGKMRDAQKKESDNKKYDSYERRIQALVTQLGNLK